MRIFRSKAKIVLAILWIGYATAPAAAQSLKIPFAALSPTYTPLWIADQAGLFKKYGLDVRGGRTMSEDGRVQHDGVQFLIDLAPNSKDQQTFARRPDD
jgi:hypothetical protein